MCAYKATPSFSDGELGKKLLCFILVSMVLAAVINSNLLFGQVFEDTIQGWERVSDADGVVQYKFWHELVIHTNQTQDLMFMVYVQSPQETAEARMKHLDEELKVFFESEEAKKCRIISIYTKVTHM